MVELNGIFTLLVSFASLAFASELLAMGAEKLEDKLGQGIAGGIVLGLMTALPETLIVIEASVKGEYQVALGSALGGNVILFTLGIGLVGLTHWSRWKENIKMTGDYQVENKFLLLSTVIMIIIVIFEKLNFITSIITGGTYIAYFIYRLKQGYKDSIKNSKGLLISSFEIGVGGIIIVIASNYFVTSISCLSNSLRVPAIWLSLVITPIAAELEEKISAIRLTMRRKQGSSIALVSFMGSKIENSTLLLAIIGGFTSLSMLSSLPELLAAIIANFIGFSILYDGKLGKLESIILVLSYFAMIFITFIV
ncbi:Na(+)/Ca(2+) exchanging [Candidatus Acidianus copahuensis]|uniref:Na(+)/Ca(2+) exchanging n=1 Tax=Candidatus Acidianus copahuensis TaxID=1160895 RepID=A0A031LQK5_9CREN|nr:sodium:calcium antiporter [Candidatus Acidianus copahuensis]EZQ07040.1 Na(+)/Ca(2+) exchanging [Candidatus Acidianus copahuensis]